MEDDKLKAQFEECFKLLDLNIPRWQREFLANIAYRPEQYLIIPRKRGRTCFLNYFYKEWQEIRNET